MDRHIIHVHIPSFPIAVARVEAWPAQMRTASRSSAPERPRGEAIARAIRLYQARHPLLDPSSVVPIDVDLDKDTFGVVITGPNTGGKTVVLKTAGLFCLMAQSGMHVPAEPGSGMSCFAAVLADIGDGVACFFVESPPSHRDDEDQGQDAHDGFDQPWIVV